MSRIANQCRTHGVQARLAKGDVSMQREVERMVSETEEEFGGFDIAVSNAAYSARELFYEADMSGFERTVQVTMWP